MSLSFCCPMIIIVLLSSTIIIQTNGQSIDLINTNESIEHKSTNPNHSYEYETFLQTLKNASKLIKRYDLNHDWQLDRIEFQKLIKCEKFDIIIGWIEFQRLDTDHNGHINIGDFFNIETIIGRQSFSYHHK
ncbi:hypothetical protein DERP_005356 [Dermatophagoides pteronyssinus]|uniref:EF-hand domain-containing protein n=1 Tax=Dermatophagoides pteronyssinus TaxID=6956 RepID=A0ABQ8JN53_DERPT|nr:hypothetical protein DERP_005356 [Dermatophagoides pteronyssinus]